MQATPRVIDYLNPPVPDDVNPVELPVVEANPDTLQGYGALVDDPENHPIEIVTWPKPGWRDLDTGTGDEGGTTEGTFAFQWTNPPTAEATKRWPGPISVVGPTSLTRRHPSNATGHTCGTPITTQMAGSFSIPWMGKPLSHPSHYRATMSNRKVLLRSTLTAAKACTCIPGCGTKHCSYWPTAADFSTSKARSMHVSASILRLSSGVC